MYTTLRESEHACVCVCLHTHTRGVTILPTGIDVRGFMSKIQLHRFKRLESGQSWVGINAAVSVSEKTDMTGVSLIRRKAANNVSLFLDLLVSACS